MINPIPAEGYSLISGKRKPPANMGEKLFCQIRTGWCDTIPWPVDTTVWIHDGSAGDLVAVKTVESKDG